MVGKCQLSKRQKRKNNRLCAEEALSRGNTKFAGFCIKDHGETTMLIRFRDQRWYCICSECAKDLDTLKATKATKDLAGLQRQRLNRPLIVKALKEGNEYPKLHCAHHKLTTYRVNVIPSGYKTVSCLDCKRCITKHRRNYKAGNLPMLHQWIAVDQEGNVPRPTDIVLPETDRLMRLSIGEDRCFMEMEDPWHKSRITGLNIKKISDWRIENRPDFLYNLPQPPTHLLMGTLVKKLPVFRKVTHIHVVRLKEMALDSIDTFKISDEYQLVGISDWFTDGKFEVRTELFYLKKHGE